MPVKPHHACTPPPIGNVGVTPPGIIVWPCPLIAPPSPTPQLLLKGILHSDEVRGAVLSAFNVETAKSSYVFTLKESRASPASLVEVVYEALLKEGPDFSLSGAPLP